MKATRVLAVLAWVYAGCLRVARLRLKASGVPRRVRAASRSYSREVGRGTAIIILHGGLDFDRRYLIPELDRLSPIRSVSVITTSGVVADLPLVCSPKASRSDPTSQIWRR
jgi:hypothetical protein